MRIKRKLNMLVGIPIMSLIGLVIFGWYAMSNMQGDLQQVVDHQFVALIDNEITPLIESDMLPLINEDIEALQGMKTSIALMLEADRDVHQAVIAEKMSLVASEDEEITIADQSNLENIEQAEARMKLAAEYFDTPESRAKYAEFRTTFADWREKSRKVIEFANTPGKLKFARKSSDNGSALATFETMRSTIDGLQMIQEKSVEAALADINLKKERIAERQAGMDAKKTAVLNIADTTEQESSAATNIFIITGLLTALVAFVIGIPIARSILVPVARITNAAEAIASGDVEQEIDVQSNDEMGLLANSFRRLIAYMKELSHAAERIAANDLTVEVAPQSDRDVLGNAFHTMIENLSGIIRQVAINAEQLVSAATEIASSSELMSHGANDQATQIAQVSTAIEEISATIVESSHNAREVTEAARIASDTAATGGTIVGETMQGMQRIANVVRESSESIGKLAQSADRIGEIISVIDDIADQTNLLALNAAIEAARAGEQGRGFAVVADEVRKLAERTGTATGEITSMIKGIQSETQDAVKSMESGIVEVDKGRRLADNAGASLGEIVTVSQRVMDMIQQIAGSTEQQSIAAEEISKTVEAVASITKETASGAEQSAAAAEQLNRQADGLMQMVSLFKMKV
jgi:methyl-accepting chemotaxis protein